MFRLWGFSPNLKGLREPARFQDFIAATLTDRDPWGGSALENFGFRAKQERLTPAERNVVPVQDTPEALDMQARVYLLTALDRLLARGISVGVFFTPQYRRSNEFESTGAGYDSYRQFQSLGGSRTHVLEVLNHGTTTQLCRPGQDYLYSRWPSHFWH